MTEEHDDDVLWERIALTIEVFHGERGLAVVKAARLAKMNPHNLLSLELDGPHAIQTYPVLTFDGVEPRESFVFSREGGFRRVALV
ncbi:MAG: hypothetical protein K2X61_02625 [Caulobacteraceae bacterium]|nr:hypothetical protein [Caulobacteraceae bacterium]